jgi:hypothetical protein
MTLEEHEELLRSTIRFALMAYRYKPPRTPDTDVTDRYYAAVAAAIIEQIKRSWTFEEPDVLRKDPPLRQHSDSQHYSAKQRPPKK